MGESKPDTPHQIPLDANIKYAVLAPVLVFVLASHADVLRGSSRVPAPQTSADLSGKNLDQSQQTSRSGKCTLDLEEFRPWLLYSSRKDQKGPMKGEDLTVLEQTTQLTHKRSYSRLTISLKKITSEVKFAERKSALLQNNNVWKKILPFVQSYKVTPLLHHPKNNFMSKWHLIQPLQREIYKKPTLISYILVRSKNLWSRITLYRACTYVFGLSTLT